MQSHKLLLCDSKSVGKVRSVILARRRPEDVGQLRVTNQPTLKLSKALWRKMRGAQASLECSQEVFYINAQLADV